MKTSFKNWRYKKKLRTTVFSDIKKYADIYYNDLV